MKMYGCLALAMTAMSFASGCGSSTPTPVDGGTSATDVPGTTDRGVTPRSDVPVSTASGTCATPIDLATAGTPMGSDLVFRGTTAGAADELHPYEGCVMHDASEAVLRYRIPAGVQALQITTEGSSYDTALYVRSACSQAAGGSDLACNNDSYDHAPQSTVYVTNAIEGQVLFIVVDGNAAMDTVSSGAFTLTVHPVMFGAQGNPCRPVTDPPMARCDGALRCSEGGAADGTAICVPTVAVNAACDPRFFNNVCAEGSTCVTDPAPPEGTPATSACALPGTRRAAPCRAAAPRCDSPFSCSAGDTPSCVPTLAMGISCDPMGEGNRCAMGLTCSALGDGGAPLCHN